MQEKIKTENYIDKELKSESDSDSDSIIIMIMIVILIVKKKFENVNQIVTIINTFEHNKA